MASRDEELHHTDDPPLTSTELNENEYVPSPEDAAWADSCLVSTHELPPVVDNNDDNEHSWKGLTEALLDALASQPSNVFGSQRSPLPDSHQVNMSGNPSYVEELAAAFDYFNADENDQLIPVDEETKEEGPPARIWFQGKEYMLPPTNTLDERNSDFDAEHVPTISVEDLESTENVFQMWDLDTPDDEEDELSMELRKALGGEDSPFRVVQPVPALDDPSTGLTVQELDELVNGFTDLSLREPSLSD